MSARAMHHRGFSLVEMAIVLLIVGLMSGAVIEPLMSVRARALHKAAIDQLDTIKSSLIAQAVASGALPCPQALHRAGHSLPTITAPVVPPDSKPCRQARGGIPAGVLGLAGAVNEHGLLLDPWGRPYRYALSLHSHDSKGRPEWPDWSTPGEATRVGLGDLAADLLLCGTAVRSACPRRQVRASGVVFVVLSLGEDDSLSGLQYENQDDDQYFLMAESSVEPENRYDDYLVWATAPDVAYWLLRAGWLP